MKDCVFVEVEIAAFIYVEAISVLLDECGAERAGVHRKSPIERQVYRGPDVLNPRCGRHVEAADQGLIERPRV